MFPPSESPDDWGFSGGRGFQAPIGKVTEPDYSVRLTSPPVQQPLSGQKRGRPLSEPGNFTGTDVSDRASVVKLFVGSVPRTALEEEVRPLFEQHGNVLEVALIKDKRTGQQQGMFISILLVIYTFFCKVSGLLKRLMGSNPSLIIGLHLFATHFGAICVRLLQQKAPCVAC
jgi:hypothetical protein